MVNGGTLHKLYKYTTHLHIMGKITERIQVSISKEQKDRLEELKIIFEVNTYSKALQKLIDHGKI